MKDYLSGYAVELKSVSQDNMMLLFEWRNQPEIRSQMVNTEKLELAQHQNWFAKLAARTEQKHYVIYYKQHAIGSINVRSTDGQAIEQTREAEVGLYIGEEKYRNNIVAFAPSLLINDYLFENLNIQQLRSKVRSQNKAALKYNQQLGYQLKPIDEDFTEIILTADNYKQTTQQIKAWLSRG
ncbi:GNAT family N-acetyltransferase [Catenovulum sediminis]|uniref:GNAT family N-acetyltransferase n=1 Tax=Catenovulum sediminis TaxID=1740262 RepID=A0ABV1RGZ3_9ALTE